MIREIITEGQEILATAAEPVAEITEDIKQLAADMIETMVHNMPSGLGLAAPQVGESVQVLIMREALNSKRTSVSDKPFMVMINPQIKKIYGENKIVFREGCLSVPDKICVVKRHQGVKVHYLDLNGNGNTIRLEDTEAVVFQHEYDHLRGKLMNTTEGFQWSNPHPDYKPEATQDTTEPAQEEAAATAAE